MQVAIAEGVKGAIADFVRFRCPLVAPAGAKPSAAKSANYAEVIQPDGIHPSKGCRKRD